MSICPELWVRKNPLKTVKRSKGQRHEGYVRQKRTLVELRCDERARL